MPSDKRNSIMAKAMGLMFSMFNVTCSREVPYGIPQYVQCILHGLSNVLLCVPYTLADSKRCRFGGNMWFHFVTEIIHIFHSGYFDCRGAF